MTRSMVILALLSLIAGGSASAADGVAATIYKNAGCKCCDRYSEYLQANGFRVTVVTPPNMSVIKKNYGVSASLEGCHTAIIDGYVIEGHVPAASIKRLVAERPAIKGIALPGMPEGSPGMSGEKAGPFKILSITDRKGAAPVYATE